MTTTAYERILDALRDAGSSWRDQAGYVIAQCPAHDDTRPSLSIREVGTGDEGQVLLNCHAGCTAEDITGALGLQLRDLFNNPKGARYTYGDGRVVTRSPTKAFKQYGNTHGTALFHAERIADAELVYVVEGEKDVLAIESLGAAAVTPAMGAGKAHRFDWSPLTGKTAVVIPDNDEAGRRHADEVAALLTPIAADVRIMLAAVGKDAADHIAAGHSLAELVDITPDKLADMFDSDWLATQAFPALEYHIPELVPEGLGVLAAPPKSGKSWLVLALAIAASCAGRALGHLTIPRARPVLYMALEDGQRRLLERSKVIGNGDDRWRNHNLHYIIRVDSPGGALDTIHAFLRRYADQQPLIIVDTFGRIKPPRPNGAEAYQHDYQVAAQLKNLVDTCRGASMLMVHHTRKAESADFVDSISGTYGLAAAADYVLVLKHKRHTSDAILSVTGRDVTEAEYALEANEGGPAWTLCGDDLREAANEAETRSLTANLGERALEVLAFVNGRDQSTRPADVANELGISNDSASTYLGRLVERGRIRKTGRGKYSPTNVPVCSVGSVLNIEHTEQSQQVFDSHARAREDNPDRNSEPIHEPPPPPPPSKPPAPRCQNCDTPLSQPASIHLGLCAECKLLALNLDPEDPNYPKWSPHGDI